MKSLSKNEVETKDELISDFNKKSEIVRELHQEYLEAAAKLNDAITDLNETVADLENFRSDIFNQMEEYFDGKSEKWQEGDTGSAYRDWMDEWSNLSLDPMEMVNDEDIDIPDVSLYEEVATEFHGG